VFANVLTVVDQLVAQHLLHGIPSAAGRRDTLHVRCARAEARNAIDHVFDEVKAIEIV